MAINVRQRTARFTMEILKPVPIAPLRVDVTPVRTGRRVQYVQASLTSEGTEVARASSWRIRTSEDADDVVCNTPIQLREVRAVTNETAALGGHVRCADGRQAGFQGHRGERLHVAGQLRCPNDYQRLRAGCAHRLE